MISNLLFAAAGNSGGGGGGGVPEIGQAFQGGFYAGLMNYGVPGENYYLIVSPRSGAATSQWKTEGTADPINSLSDGLANSLALNNPIYVGIYHCLNYINEGYDDWYLPSRDELELLYRTFKPNTTLNSIIARVATAGGGANGENPSSVPPGLAYTAADPAQTTIPGFIGTADVQAFTTANHLSSSTATVADINAIHQNFNTGLQTVAAKTGISRVSRPVRRVLAPQ